MKKTLSAILIVTILLVFQFKALAAPSIQVSIDGNKISFHSLPIVEQGTTLAEMRPLCDNLGLKLHWDRQNQIITAYKKGLSINLKIGSTTATVNNASFELPIAPRIVNKFTYIPLRFLAEVSNKTVTWDSKTNTVNICKK